jgi:hypothetical protein
VIPEIGNSRELGGWITSSGRLNLHLRIDGHHLVHGATAARPDVANLVKRDTVITLPVASWNVNAVPTGPQKTGSCSELGVGVADTDLADACSAGAWSEALHAPRVSPPPKARSQSGHRG